jgi:hypothetical protein
MPASARFGAAVPNVYGALLSAETVGKRYVRTASITVNTSSGLVSVAFPAKNVLFAVATCVASSTATSFDVATLSSVGATGTVSVVDLHASAGGVAVGGAIAVSVMADFY